MDKNKLYNALRNVYGLPTTYTDTWLDNNILDLVLLKVSEWFPAKELTYLVTVKDQTRYQVTHSDLIKIDEVFYYQSNVDDGNIWGDPDIVTNANNFNLSTFYASRFTELVSRLKLLRDLNPCDAKIVSYDTFDLFPTPSDSNTIVYYEYSRKRQLSEIPDILLDEVAKLFIYFIGEKSVQEQLLDPKGNKYLFDRRGNIMSNQGTQEIMQRSRQTQLDAIEKKIREKTILMK